MLGHSVLHIHMVHCIWPMRCIAINFCGWNLPLVSLRRGAFDHYVYNIFPDVADHLLLVHSVVRFGHLRLQMGIYVLKSPIVK